MAKKLKVEDIPEGFNYAAVDSDGWAYLYKSRPILDNDGGVWKCLNETDSVRRIARFDSGNWQESLVSRETAEQPKRKKLTMGHIPGGYSYAAVNANGRAYAFDDEPEPRNNGTWDFKYCNGKKLFIGKFDSTDWENSVVPNETDLTDWENSVVSCETAERPEPKKLTAADIPDGFSYAAVNENGSGYAFKTRPLLSGLFWAGGCEIDGYEFLGGFDSGNWQNSLVSRETTTRPELKKLTSADIPEGYNYAAVDSSGNGFTYQGKPKRLNTIWVNADDMDHFFIGQFDPGDWKNSLISRETAQPETAYKETANKLSYSEIDPYFLEQMARRMQKGKEKYGPNNWKKLSDINELLDAAQRHLLELRKMVQEDFEPLPDQESEAQHCAALACNAMFIHYHLNPNT